MPKQTIQQTAFIDVILNGAGHVCLRARAGTGKTTTILMATVAKVRAASNCSIAICAFGKGIQTEIAGKLEAAGIDWKVAQAVTTHSMGFGLVRATFKGIKVDDNKVRDLIREQNHEVFGDYFAQIRELVHLAKLEGFGFFDDAQIGDTHAWYRTASHYSVNGFDDTSDMDKVVKAAQHIYRLSLNKVDVIDFDDMVLFPLVKNLAVRYPKDLIFLDEAQDTSRARRALVKKFLKPRTGRLVIVGDDRQAIMGFAGASADALDEMVAETKATVLPLTTTWRCPRAVVELAQEFVPDIEAAEKAAEGTVEYRQDLPADLKATDAILCRATAPLVDVAYDLIRRGIACKVEGREIGKGLLKVLDKWATVRSINDFLERLDFWQDRETQKAIAKGRDEKVQEIEDRAETLRVVCRAVHANGSNDLADVRRYVENLFADNVQDSGLLTLATLHRSKGREWPRVFLLDWQKRCPSRWAKQDWQIRQEHNLQYVGITRAQETLVFVDRPEEEPTK